MGAGNYKPFVRQGGSVVPCIAMTIPTCYLLKLQNHAVLYACTSILH